MRVALVRAAAPVRATVMAPTAVAAVLRHMPSRAFSVTASALSAAGGESKQEDKSTGLFGSIMADFRAEQEDMKGLSGWGKVKHLFSRYGFLSIVVYETVFFSALGGFYGLFVLVSLQRGGTAVGTAMACQERWRPSAKLRQVLTE